MSCRLQTTRKTMFCKHGQDFLSLPSICNALVSRSNCAAMSTAQVHLPQTAQHIKGTGRADAVDEHAFISQSCQAPIADESVTVSIPVSLAAHAPSQQAWQGIHPRKFLISCRSLSMICFTHRHIDTHCWGGHMWLPEALGTAVHLHMHGQGPPTQSSII